MQRSRISDVRCNPGALEHALRQQEFGIKILRLRLLVHDGDATEHHRATLQPPLVAEHLEENLLKIFFSHRNTRPSGLALAVEQQRIQESASRVAVDFDKVDAVAVQVKGVAEKHASGG